MFLILSSLIFLPLLGAALIVLVPKNNVPLIRMTALVATGLVLAFSIVLLSQFDHADPSMQFVERVPWIPFLNVWYFVGVDGLSITLVFLTALLGFLACVASATIHERLKEYYVLYLLLMTGMMGTFLALDLFVFYVFWEAVLIPMYFLIGVWGGPRKEYAATKFLLYTLAGSVFMLIGILAAYFAVIPHTFDILELAEVSSAFGVRFQVILFLVFYFAFAVKVPVFPFHTWLPDAHVEAPTPISVLLAGVLLKMGGYGLVRICLPIFSDAVHLLAYPLAVLAAVNIVYGASVAMAQTDFKKMIAYSSVSHMGFVLLGVASMNAAGLNGALVGMFSHGIVTAGMFLLVGMLYERAHTRDLNHFGGLSGHMPVYAFCLTFCSMASLGLPGLSGFVGEFLSLAGAFPVYRTISVLAVIGLILTAGYFLYMVQRVLLGPVHKHCQKYSDIGFREVFVLAPLMAIAVVVGVYPMSVLTFQGAAVQALAGLFS